MEGPASFKSVFPDNRPFLPFVGLPTTGGRGEGTEGRGRGGRRRGSMTQGAAPRQKPGKEAGPFPGEERHATSQGQGEEAQHGQGKRQGEGEREDHEEGQRQAARGQADTSDQRSPGAQVAHHTALLPRQRGDGSPCILVQSTFAHGAPVESRGAWVNGGSRPPARVQRGHEKTKALVKAVAALWWLF